MTMTGTVYAIRCGQYVKIGVTADLAERVRQLRRKAKGTVYPDDLDTSDMEPLFAVAGTVNTEFVLHAAFKSERACGEWYHYRGTVRAWCDEIRRWPPRLSSLQVDFRTKPHLVAASDW